MNFKKNKKGIQQGAVFVIIVLLIIAGMAFFLGKSQTPGKLSVTSSGGVAASQDSTPTSRINLVDKTTVTFSSWDIRNQATNAGTGHLLLKWKDATGANKGVGKVYADDGTETMSPDDSYQVLLGNVTKSAQFTAGTTYYPIYVTGSVPDSGTHAISAGQYLTAGVSQITFAFFDINGQVQASTGQAIGTSDDKTVKFKVTPNADTCVGNPDTGGENIVTYLYNGSVFTTVEQYTVGNVVPDSSTSTPRGAQATFANVPDVYLKASYPAPVVCGPASIEKQVRLKTGSTNNPGAEDNVSVVFSDISWGYNTKTFELIKGYVDDQNTDLGVTDFVAGALLTS